MKKQVKDPEKRRMKRRMKRRIWDKTYRNKIKKSGVKAKSRAAYMKKYRAEKKKKT